MSMNKVLEKVVKIGEEAISKYLPEVELKMLEESGKLYYMNDIDGTLFDWQMNERLCEFMSFYNESGMGAVKINVLADGIVNVYLFKDNAKSCFYSYQEFLNKDEVLELAVLMYNIADKKELYGKAVNDMNSNIVLTLEDYQEFNNN